MRVVTIPVGMISTNCFLVSVETGEAAIIDPGAQPERILQAVWENALEPKLILLTHGHFDHIGAVDALAERLGIPVYIHKLDQEMLGDPLKNGGAALTGETVTAKAGGVFQEGDSFLLGELDFRVLHTPGHTKGSSCFLCGDALFTGDTLFAGGMGRTDLYGGSYPELSASLKKLAALSGDYRVYPGHGPASALEQERQRNPYMGRISYDDLF